METGKILGLVGPLRIQHPSNFSFLGLCELYSTHAGDFPGGLHGKESTCSAGNPSSIAGLRSSSGEGRGYPLQYSWTSLVAQMVKNQPAMWETWVQSLGWEYPLEEVMDGNPLRYRFLENPHGQRNLVGYSP